MRHGLIRDGNSLKGRFTNTRLPSGSQSCKIPGCWVSLCENIPTRNGGVLLLNRVWKYNIDISLGELSTLSKESILLVKGSLHPWKWKYIQLKFDQMKSMSPLYIEKAKKITKGKTKINEFLLPSQLATVDIVFAGMLFADEIFRLKEIDAVFWDKCITGSSQYGAATAFPEKVASIELPKEGSNNFRLISAKYKEDYDSFYNAASYGNPIIINVGYTIINCCTYFNINEPFRMNYATYSYLSTIISRKGKQRRRGMHLFMSSYLPKASSNLIQSAAVSWTFTFCGPTKYAWTTNCGVLSLFHYLNKSIR